jgi:arylsulfatase A-like enzyme
MNSAFGRVIGIGLLVMAGAAGPAAAAQTPPQDSPPNILFILSDDHAYQAVSAYGSGLNRTPQIDRLAQEGMLFRNCWVTNSLCGPSRASILTGKYSHRNGFYSNSGDRFDGSQQTFPKLLQKAGYQTAIVGKWHLETDPTGFDYWHILPGQGQYYNPPMIDNGQRVKHTGYVTDIITDLALGWLEKRDPKKPFLLMCHHKAPHREWEPALRHLHLYDHVTFPEPETLFDDYSGRGIAEHTEDMTIAKTMTERDLKLVAPRDLNPEQRKEWDAAYDPLNDAFRKANLQGKDLVRWKYQRYMKEYLSTIAAIDENVGRILKYLDQSGLAKNTIVVYASDQGFFLGEHGWFDKRWIFAESLRTPLLVRWPGVTPPGSKNGDIVSNLDFGETFLDAAGLGVPPDMQGRSFKPMLAGQKAPEDWRKSFYYHYYEHPGPHNVRAHYGVVTERHKLVHFYGDIDEWELFDLQKDPHEMKSVFADPVYAETALDLKKELSRLQKDLGETDPEVPLAELLRRRSKRPPGKLELVLELEARDEKERKDLDPSGKPISVGAWCTPNGSEGVLLAQGGAAMGYTLYLKDGQPHFGVRNGGTLKEVVGKEKLPPGQAVHLVGVLDENLELHLYVNGEEAGKALGHFLAGKPADPLTIGRDGGSPVGDYEAPFPFLGELRDIRIYWGSLDLPALRKWAGR